MTNLPQAAGTWRWGDRGFFRRPAELIFTMAGFALERGQYYKGRDGLNRGERGWMAEKNVLRSELLDVTGLDLAGLRELPDNALQESLRRILAEARQVSDQYLAQFQSAI